MAPRTVSTQGPLGLLNRSPNGSANGVTPFLSPSAMSFVRGSEPVYLLPERSVRPGRSPFLAMISTCWFSSSVHCRKFHACALCLDDFEMPATSPPTNVAVFDPSGDINEVTPHWKIFWEFSAPTMGEPSASMPTLPPRKLFGQVDPSCVASLLATSFSWFAVRYMPKICLKASLLMSTFLPSAEKIFTPAAQAYGKRVDTLQP